MDRRTMIALLLIGGAGFGYYFWNQKKSNAESMPQDQGPAEAAAQYYAPPPTFAAEPFRNTDLYLNQKQAMPLPFNT